MSTNGSTTGPVSPTRSSLYVTADQYLVANGIQWNPSRVMNAVKQFEKHSHDMTLQQFLAGKIATQLAKRRGQNANYKRITYSDPVGEEVAHKMSKYVPLKVAAETVGVSVSSLRRYIAEGRITAHRVGPKLIRVDIAQVEAQLYGNVGGDAA
ncbi:MULTISPECIES: helix-turn-helix domain-containing protein [Mycobacteriaceae]|uniref:helix-turn-helix domain-containing protein n=1 Tax=Mycobacteriaceae TaxID=1762 RepID=UPI001EF09426|nr:MULTISPECIES: helix-turn-helix domain-containing protein [Mycobacteriaceae]